MESRLSYLGLLFYLIWKKYILNWYFDSKSWFLDFFFTCFNHKKTPQNFSLKNNYYSLGLLKWYFLHFNVSFWHLVGYISAKRDSGMNAKLEDLIIGQEILIFQPFFNSVPSYHYAIISAISQRRNHQLATIGFANLGIKNDFSKLLSISAVRNRLCEWVCGRKKNCIIYSNCYVYSSTYNNNWPILILYIVCICNMLVMYVLKHTYLGSKNFFRYNMFMLLWNVPTKYFMPFFGNTKT